MSNEKYFFRVKRCETNISPKNTKGAQYIVRVLCWIVFCVIEGFLGVIVRHVDHGGTSLTGYPGARVPAPLIRKTRRMLGQTRTLRRVALVRVNSLYPGCRRAYGTPTTRYVVGATVYDRGNIRGSACRDDHVQTYCIYAQAGWKTQERDADSFRLALATRTST